MLIVTLIICCSVFTQSLIGFGSALLAMPLLTELLGIQVAAPLVALIGLTIEVLIILRYRHILSFRAIGRLAVGSMLGIPLGVLIIGKIGEAILLPLLGLLVTGYALYALFGPQLPEIKHQGWAYGLGFIGGVLAGAYNTGGPPIVIYGTGRRWSPAEFKINLQTLFILNSLTIIVAHALARNFTPVVWQYYGAALPGLALGMLVGFSLDRYINPALFRKLVLALLVVLGIRLIF